MTMPPSATARSLPPPSTCFLIGARASGKTTLGRALAGVLGYEFVDTDALIMDAGGMTVREVVEREGWEGFRRREAAALREAAGPERVVATGGGMVLARENREFMRGHGTILHLAAPALVLAGRLAANPEAAQRPSLTGKDIVAEIAEVLDEREPLYRETASRVLDAALPPEALLAAALRALGKEPPVNTPPAIPPAREA